MAELFSILTFDEVKVSEVLNISDVYTTVATLNTPLRAAGKYMLGLSLTYTFTSTTNSAFLQWRIDGGAWNVYQREPKDNTDKTANFYSYPDDYAEGAHTVEVQMRKEDAAGTLDIQFLDIYFQRIG